jgi:uncharacterized protein
LVLIRDLRQLGQPMRGCHPEGTNVSALDHLLEHRQAIGPDQGRFLDETWRLHRQIYAFTPELFYAGELGSRAGLRRQSVHSTGPLDGYGVRYLPAEHNGDRNASPEEAAAIRMPYAKSNPARQRLLPLP